MLKRVKLLFCMILCLFNYALPSSVSAAQLIGDLNGDLKVDIGDALLTLKYIIGLIPHNATNDGIFLASADIAPLDPFTNLPKGDEKVDIADALGILRHVVNLDTWIDNIAPSITFSFS